MKPPHKCSITAHRPNHFHPNCQNEKIFPLRWESRTANSSIPSRRTSPLGDTVPPPPPPEITASNPTPNRRRFTDAAAQPPPKARCRLPPDLDTANKPVQLSYKRCQTKPARKFTRISGEISQHGKSCKARVRSCQLNQQKVPTHQEETSQHGESNWTVLTHQWYTSQHGKSNTAMHSAKPATPNRPFFHKFIPSEDSFTPSVGKCWLPYYSKKFPLPLTQPENTHSHLPTDSGTARQVLQGYGTKDANPIQLEISTHQW